MLFLILLDQLIKIIINAYFLDARFTILNPFFEFEPTFNNKYSYLNSLLHKKFDIDLGIWFHIVINIVIFILVFFSYRYLRNNLNRSKLFDISFIFCFSGILSAFISTYIWIKGCLDYIYLKPLFVFDLKDLYLNCSIILFLIYFHKNRKIIKALDEKKGVHFKNLIRFRKKTDMLCSVIKCVIKKLKI